MDYERPLDKGKKLSDAGPAVDVVVEIPRSSRNKYEYDDERHAFVTPKRPCG